MPPEDADPELLGILADLSDQLEAGALTPEQQRTAGWILRASVRRLATAAGCPDAITAHRDPGWVSLAL